MILQSTNGESWTRFGDPFPNKQSADGACGAARARVKGAVQLRVAPIKKRPHITVLLGAVAADLWLRGFDEGFIYKHVSKHLKKHYASQPKLTPPKPVA